MNIKRVSATYQEGSSAWTGPCNNNTIFNSLAPTKASNPLQVNEPIGLEQAHSTAEALGFEKSFLLTESERDCFLRGTTIEDPVLRAVYVGTLRKCLANLSNTKGGHQANILFNIAGGEAADLHFPALASYGLKLRFAANDGHRELMITSDCSPNEPCINFNKLLAGPLEATAKQCGFLAKFEALFSQTPIVCLGARASKCQEQVISFSDSCLALNRTEDNGDKEYYGLAVTPWLWLVNFSLIYFADPRIAAYMPKYRYNIPAELAAALFKEKEVRFEAFKKLLITT
jgi:hypothetical protein